MISAAVGVAVEDENAGEAVGSVLLEKLGRLPRKGDQVRIAANASATVVALSRRRITRVRIKVDAAPTEA